MSTIQNYVLAGFVLCGIMSITPGFACMPHSPDDVFIARFQSSQAMNQENTNFAVALSSDQFIFRSFMDRWRYSNPKQWHSAFSSEHVAKDSLIIGLAYTPDGGKPEQYQITSFAELSCKNDQLSISKPIAPFLAWNRSTSSCVHTDQQTIDILDGFLEHDQAYYLAQLQQKYPTCEKLNEAFPSLEKANAHHSQSVTGWRLWLNQLIKWLIKYLF